MSNKKNYLLMYIVLQYTMFFILYLVFKIESITWMYNTLLGFLLYNFIFISIFIIPPLIYISIVNKCNPLDFIKLKQNMKRGIFIGLIISLILTLIIHLPNLITHKTLSFKVNTYKLLAVLLVGFYEELPFRGFLLNEFNKYFSFSVSNIVTSILFICIHIPSWLVNGNFDLKTIFSLFCISIVFGYLYKESDSLWSVIIFHSMYNLNILIL